MCEQHTMADTGLPKTQTTSPITAHFQRFSPRWSALCAPHHPEPRPHCQQTGGNCTNRGATRRRHAEGRPLMAQNPHQRCGTTRRSRRASEEPESVGGAGERRRARAGPQDAGQTEAPEGGRRSPGKFRMQFSPSNNHRESKIRRISTIRFQYLKYAQGNCMRN